MPSFLLLVFVIALLVAVLYGLAYVDARTIVRNLRRITGVVLLVVAGILVVAGRWVLALPLAYFAVSILVRGAWPGFSGSARKSPGQRSRVRSRHLDMILEHDSGEMEGTVRSGRFTGEQLNNLSLAELKELYSEVAQDAESLALLDTYLDRRFPDWRGAAGDAAGANGQGGEGRAGGSTEPMTVQEAHNVLGVGRGASEAQIRAAHRRLMKNLHPDQGGSTYLATKLNEARDLLLGRRGKRS